MILSQPAVRHAHLAQFRQGQATHVSDWFLGQVFAQFGYLGIMRLEAVLHNDFVSCGLGANNCEILNRAAFGGKRVAVA